MRTSNYKKKLQIDKKAWKILGIVVGTLILAGGIFFFTYYQVENVEVMESKYYSKEEVKEMVLRGPLASNSVLAPMLYSTDDVGDIPFVDGFRVSQISRDTIAVSVREKKPVGCIPYLDSYIYFDRTGVFIESSLERDKTVPYFDGIQVNYVIKDEMLPIKGDTVLNTAVALATIFEKNDTVPDHIQFDSSYQISLLYGDITVQLGKDEFLEDKMARVIAILPKLAGQKGTLHLESVTDSVKTVTFEREVGEYTAANWPGGYDENGEFTGDGEYDETGMFVGPKPESELDYILENWVGGYDEELDYTGAGEYDVNGNYVGPPPTEEDLAAKGDWTGGFNQDGGYDGVGEYDKDGNHVGPNPNAGDEENGGSGDGYLDEDSDEENSGDGYSDDYSDGGYSGDGYSDGYSDGDDSGDGYSDGYSDGYGGDGYSDGYYGDEGYEGY